MGLLRSCAPLGVIALWLVACGGDPEHPPNLASHGVGGGGNTTGGGSGGASGSSTGGTGGAPCDPDPTLGKTLSGNIIVYDPVLATKAPFVGNGTAVIEGVPCGWVQADFYGSTDPVEPFVLAGAKPLPQSWIHFFQHDKGTEDVVPTLQAVYTVNDLTLMDEFAFVRGSEIDALYASLGVERDPAKGTVLIQAVTVFGALKTPVSGAIVSTLGEAQIAYASGGSWALGAGPTDASGMAVLVNAAAEPFPGKSIGVHLEEGNKVFDLTAPVQAGGVSILTFNTGF
jgi:hypothetical protein